MRRRKKAAARNSKIVLTQIIGITVAFPKWVSDFSHLITRERVKIYEENVFLQVVKI